MVNLVKNLQTALGERIQAQEWMSDSTKVRAQEKLATFHVKVGYPDKWKDYSDLKVEKDSYWANVCRAAAWERKDNYSRLGKPVDKDEWLMTPQTVNAYYNPSTNEICFPAAILDGNLKDWWAAGDADRFKERAQVMVDFFDNIEVLPGLHANGTLTLGENLADHGGLNVAYLAYKNATANAPLEDKDGFTPDQRFFLAYATLWAGNIRDEQIQAWYDAFNITPSDPLYLAPEKRVNVW